MLYVGGLRPRHVIGAYEDLGMEIVGAGYEFAHNDDYDRTLKELPEATLLFDDVTGYEFEEFVKAVKPDLIGSGIKENSSSRKWASHSVRCTLGITQARTTASTASPSSPVIWI